MVAGRLNPVVLLVALAAVAGAIFYAGRNPADIGKTVAGAAVDMATGVLVGSVETIGEQIGIPKTDISKGQAELEAGDYWNASFDLPAADFLSGIWSKVTGG